MKSKIFYSMYLKKKTWLRYFENTCTSPVLAVPPPITSPVVSPSTFNFKVGEIVAFFPPPDSRNIEIGKLTQINDGGILHVLQSIKKEKKKKDQVYWKYTFDMKKESISISATSIIYSPIELNRDNTMRKSVEKHLKALV